MNHVKLSQILSILALMFGKTISCPEKCLCFSNNIIVDCDRQQLETLPFNIPFQTEFLVASNNKITSLLPLAFQDLPKLFSITLAYNRLQKLDGDSLRNLPMLDLIILDHNFLTEVDLEFILELENLSFLNLAHNSITSVKADHIKDRPHPLEIDLRGNPLNCCEMDFLNEVANISLMGHCHYPLELDGIAIENIQAAQLTCTKTKKVTNSSYACKQIILVIIAVLASMLYFGNI